MDEYAVTAAGVATLVQSFNVTDTVNNIPCVTDVSIGTGVKDMASVSFDGRRLVVPCYSATRGSAIGSTTPRVGMAMRPDGLVASRTFTDIGAFSLIGMGTDTGASWCVLRKAEFVFN